MSIYCIFRGLGEFKKDAKPFANVEVRKKNLGENALYSEFKTTACVYNNCWNRTCGTSPQYLIYLSFVEFIFLVVFFFYHGY